MIRIKTFVGKLLCSLGLHRIEDSWCQRKDCLYHRINL